MTLSLQHTIARDMRRDARYTVHGIRYAVHSVDYTLCDRYAYCAV